MINNKSLWELRQIIENVNKLESLLLVIERNKDLYLDYQKLMEISND